MNKIIVYNPNELKDKNIPAYLNIELNKAYANEKLSYITFIFEDLSKKLSEKATEVYSELAKYFPVDFDDAGSIGKRYRRQDEIGTPFCVTVDFDTLEDNAVTVRDRDTMEQVRIQISELKNYIAEKIKF